MKQKSVGLTLRAVILALAITLLVAGSPALAPFDGVAYAQDTSVSVLDSSGASEWKRTTRLGPK